MVRATNIAVVTLFAFLMAGAGGAGQPEDAPAAAAPAAKGPEAPAKRTEEPVFKLPELVIIGENQARIMAQKERAAGSPLRGLGEAPLLEKEESAVAALRAREEASPMARMREGPGKLVRLEAGTHGWLAGAGWLGTQEPGGARGFDIAVSRLRGEPTGGGNAGGWDLEVSASGASLPRAGDAGRGGKPSFFFPFGIPDTSRAGLGWRAAGREVPWQKGRRHMNQAWISSEALRSSNGIAVTGSLAMTWVDTPRGSARIFGTRNGIAVPAWDGDGISVRVKGSAEGESAGFGDAALLGLGVEAAWVPGERLRCEAGLAAGGAMGPFRPVLSLRPVLGASWTTPAGPTVSALLSGGLGVPWLTGEAVTSPYSRFTGVAAPERHLADVTISAWQETWDGSRLRGDLRVAEVRSALSWAEEPGGGLYVPVPVRGLSLREATLSSLFRMPAGFALRCGASWREADSRGGEVAGLRKGEGKGGLDWEGGRFRAGVDLDVGMEAARSIAGGKLAPYERLGARASWTPYDLLEVFARLDNILGDTIELWGGYPEPRRMFSAGVLARF